MIFKKRCTNFIATSIAFFSIVVFELQANDANTADFSIESLLDVMEETTEIATKSRINSDWVPGMVSVLRGEEVALRGAKNVQEALAFIPGMSPVLLQKGDVMFRGFGQYIAPKIKLLLNGVTVTDYALSGTGSPVLKIPIELVERIDVIRGPGSAIYGSFALNGVVNIVTITNKDKLFLKLDNFNGRSAGLALTHTSDDLKFDLNLASSTSDGDKVHAGVDFHTREHPDNPTSPGLTNEKQSFRGLNANLQYRNWQTQVQFIKRGFTLPFGWAEILPPYSDDITEYVEHWAVDTTYLLNATEKSQQKVTFGWNRHEWKLEQYYLGRFPQPLNLLFGDYFGGTGYSEVHKHYINFEKNWLLSDNQRLLTIVEYSDERISDSWLETNFDFDTQMPVSPPVRRTGDRALFDENASRRTLSLVVQDQIEFNDRLTITLGVRYDDFSDLKTEVAPRLALVYLIDDQHILKAQYATAFRPPSAAELYLEQNGNKSIVTESIQTSELSYINRTPQSVVRANIFYSEITDLIELDNQYYLLDDMYVNLPGAKQKGIEFELEMKIADKFNFSHSLAWLDSEYMTNKRPLTGSIKWLTYSSLLFRPNENWVLSVNHYYKSKRNREPIDSRKPLRGEHNSSFTATYFDTRFRGLQLKFDISNLFDNQLIEPAPNNTYLDDYPRYGRQISLAIEYQY